MKNRKTSICFQCSVNRQIESVPVRKFYSFILDLFTSLCNTQLTLHEKLMPEKRPYEKLMSEKRPYEKLMPEKHPYEKLMSDKCLPEKLITVQRDPREHPGAGHEMYRGRLCTLPSLQPLFPRRRSSSRSRRRHSSASGQQP